MVSNAPDVGKAENAPDVGKAEKDEIVEVNATIGNQLEELSAQVGQLTIRLSRVRIINEDKATTDAHPTDEQVRSPLCEQLWGHSRVLESISVRLHVLTQELVLH